jgi:hypothetical protein
MTHNVKKMLDNMNGRVKEEKKKEKMEDLTVQSGPATQLTDVQLSDALDMTDKGHLHSVLTDAVFSASMLHNQLPLYSGHMGWSRAEIVNVTSRLYEQLPNTKKVLLENEYCHTSVTYENPVFQQLAFLIFHIRQWN